MNKLPLTITALLAGTTMAMSQSTIVALSDSNDYVSAYTAIDTLVEDSNGQFSAPFSLSNQMNPQSGYTPGGSGIFYGGVGTNMASPTTIGPDVVGFQSDDAFRFRLHNNAQTGDSAVGVFIWKQADWEALTSGAVSGLSFSTTGRKFGTNANQHSDFRFLVQEGGMIYVSDRILPASGNSGFPDAIGTMTLADTSSVSWYSYDPATDMQTIGAVASPSFTNVTAVGMYHELTKLTDADQSFTVEYYDFTVTAVPEPATISLMLGATVLGIVFIRRRIR